MPRQRILEHLVKLGGPKLAIPFLEFIVNVKGEKKEEFHNQLLLFYLGDAEELLRKSEAGIGSWQ